MPRGPQGQHRPADTVGCAVMVARIATGEQEKLLPEVSCRVRSGKAGASARGEKMSAVQRSDIAKKAAPGGGNRMVKKPKPILPSGGVAPIFPWAGQGSMIPFGFQMVAPIPPKTVDRRIRVAGLKDSSVELDDGAIITLTPSVQFVKSIVGQKGPTGETIYQLQLSWNIATAPPKKSGKSARKPNATGTKNIAV